MGMNFYTNSIFTDGSEQNLFDIGPLEAHHACKIFMNNMDVGDKITVRVYDWDGNGTQYVKHDTFLFEDIQVNPSWFISFIPSQYYKVTIEQTAGTYRTFNWTRIEVT